MLSRVADSIYWMSRYIERAENVARFVLVNLHLSLDLPGEAGEQWWPLVVTTGDDQHYLRHHRGYHRNDVIQFLTLARENPNSIASCLAAARENARGIREIISREMYEHLNQFYLMVRNCRGLDEILDDPYTFFKAITSCGQQFLGVMNATMTHGEPWHFARLGHMLERADKTSRILDVKYFILLPALHEVGSPYDDVQWLALLRSASGLAMYRQRHGRISPTNVVQFLVLDPEFPRAVLYCLTQANHSLHAISGTQPGSFSNPPEQRLGQLWAALAYARAPEIIDRGLHEFIDHLQQQLNLVGESIFDTFFALRPVNLLVR